MANKKTVEKAIIGLAVVAFLAMGFVFFQLNTANRTDGMVTAAQPSQSGQGAGINTDLLPKGAPRAYGAELGVSYDDVSASNIQKAEQAISKLGALDVNIRLSSEETKRYISIASQISCEYCCGVDSIIFANGQPACSCQHSYAMRGVAKYLITKHGSEFTDEEILEEMSKWKTLFFPSQMSSKADVLQEKGIALTYSNLASNKYRGIES